MSGEFISGCSSSFLGLDAAGKPQTLIPGCIFMGLGFILPQLKPGETQFGDNPLQLLLGHGTSPCPAASHCPAQRNFRAQGVNPVR